MNVGETGRDRPRVLKRGPGSVFEGVTRRTERGGSVGGGSFEGFQSSMSVYEVPP